MLTSIRAMSIEDYDAVHRLWVGTPGVGLSESDTRAATEAFLLRNPGMSAVAFVGTELVGAVLCGHDGRRGYLHHLAVSVAWRGRGFARKLLAWCFEQLSAHGIAKCNIFLFSSNAEGAAFWHHNGWVSRSDLQVIQKPVPPRRAAASNKRLQQTAAGGGVPRGQPSGGRSGARLASARRSVVSGACAAAAEPRSVGQPPVMAFVECSR